MGKVLGAIAILVLLFMIAAGPINAGIEKLRTDTVEQNIVVATNGSTNATITLSRDLFLGSPDRVLSITSNVTETPLPISYVVATKALTIDGLNPTATHLLTFNYSAETSDSTWVLLGPYLGILVYGSILAAVGFGLYATRKRR